MDRRSHGDNCRPVDRCGLSWFVTAGFAEVFTEASLTARPFFEWRGFQLIERQSVLCKWPIHHQFHDQESSVAKRGIAFVALGVL